MQHAAASWEGRILVIDSYDSYIFNICNLIATVLPRAHIFVIRNDQFDIATLIPQLSAFDWCVLGPGPGSPACAADVGVLPGIWTLPNSQLLPTLGICLGMQTLSLCFGGRLKHLSQPAHGIITKIHLFPDPLFGQKYQKDRSQENDLYDILSNLNDINNDIQNQDVPCDPQNSHPPEHITVVRYHSFHVDIDGVPDLKALAWADDAKESVLMAVRHRQKPFYGLQYHPESFFSTHGISVILNFWKIAAAFNQKFRPHRSPLSDDWRHLHQISVPLLRLNKTHYKTLEKQTEICFQVLHLDISAIEVAEHLQLDKLSCSAILESITKPGRFSILGAPSDGHYALTYTLPNTYLTKTYSDRQEKVILNAEHAWEWLANELQRWRICYSQSVPFCGGFIGYLSYEYCVYTANIIHTTSTKEACNSAKKTEIANTDFIAAYKEKHRQRPDVNLLFYERSIVIDTITKEVTIQSLIHNDPWVKETAALLKKVVKNRIYNNINDTESSIQHSSFNNNSHNITSNVQTYSTQTLTQNTYSQDSAQKTNCKGHSQNPCSQNSTQNLPQNSLCTEHIILSNKDEYLKKIQAAQDYIFNGESYELCLTSTARIFSSKPCTPANDWHLYKRLRTLNPAPFAGYIRLNNVTLLSSSPERFLSWSRDGLCELRPIKGTIRKDPSIDLEKAKTILHTPKLLAENLMILDLIRNDLYQITKNVHVPMPMQIEEYQTVYQLVSVIQGTLHPPYIGIDVLAHVLPPGSMTGAPKKRSVELLNKLEETERDIYSGVFGYFSVSGEGDWSVIIRSTFRYHNESYWNIGAGGAITILSDPQDEWDEMILKLQSVLPLFNTNGFNVRIV
ncbi:hypothetical protein PORY_001562 [Pneumocystis oryctolagi]|uniref:Uncharacterized protein n=1 Tax=Pneumocystis oryctolagi TaxID=42067 RepID=A0ACB7CEH0_9ASCO|nr:hypothetical protein PORY_001562 [Pneumocystis oryctolagi]